MFRQFFTLALGCLLLHVCAAPITYTAGSKLTQSVRQTSAEDQQRRNEATIAAMIEASKNAAAAAIEAIDANEANEKGVRL